MNPARKARSGVHADLFADKKENHGDGHRGILLKPEKRFYVDRQKSFGYTHKSETGTSLFVTIKPCCRKEDNMLHLYMNNRMMRTAEATVVPGVFLR